MNAVPLTDQQLRDRIAEALMRWAEGHNNPSHAPLRRPETVTRNAYGRADAVLAVVQPELDRVRAERDGFADRVDTLTAVAKSNKLAYRVAVEECDRLTVELEQARTELTRRRTDDLNIRGALAPADGPREVPMALGDSVAPAVEWLIAELGRVRAELATARAAAFREAARVLEDTGRDDDAVNLLDNIADGITTHACPPDNSALTPCCGRTPFELARTDRLTYDLAEITCTPTQPTT